jgi:hypothetical protein
MTPQALLGRVTSREVEDAQAHALECFRRWEQLGFASPTREDLARAEDIVDSVQRKRARARRQLDLLRSTQARARALWLVRQLAVGPVRYLADQLDVGFLPALLLAGVVPFALACLVGLLLFHSMGATLLLATAAYLLGIVLAAVAPPLLPDWIDRWPDDIARSIEEESRKEEETTLQLKRVEGQLYDLYLQDRLRRAYAEANVRYENLLRAHEDRRSRLLRTDWRSLRDVDFERFLTAVFQELGYQVETTKTTGDQGVDLILTRGSRRVAVQTKGYKDSVGNKAVQEVVAGRLYYRCDSCAAITNSTFTSGAVDLANANGCVLIDGKDITDLIRGNIHL